MDQVQDDVLAFMYSYLRKYPSNPWLPSEAVAQDVAREYGHNRTDTQEAVIRLGDVGMLKHKSQTHTIQGYKIGATKMPGMKYATVQYRISDKAMQSLAPTKHTPSKLTTTTEIHADNVVIVNGYNVGAITQANTTNIADVQELANKLLESNTLSEELKREVAVNSQLISTELLNKSPRKQIVQASWSVISKAADLAGLAAIAASIAKHFL